MEKQKDPIGQQLRKTRQSRGISVPELADMISIPKDRIYKWEKGHSPKYEDRLIIEKWISGKLEQVPHEAGQTAAFGAVLSHPLSTNGTDLTIQDYINMIKKHNDFLERMLEANLNGLSNGHQVIYAFVRASLELQAIVASGGDEKKAMELKDSLSRSLDDYRKIDLREDKAASVRT